ncbi:NAD(P)H-binding protein [Sphingosinicella sp. CPCC 101087]|uniref:NAD(P)H-binding protein n=1 Tax=Sphingosinicella sp. CPCC 101087 TaxID=2497754 RepID=UPI00101DBFBB|nr:NAD(P)H-binding protein [Sphingosinicella sp. CPCC 101087]
MARIALIGGTGLVGGLFADRQLAAGHHVLHALVRRPAGRRWQEHVAPPEQWPEIARRIRGAIAISALGTTMRAAGSWPAFRAVDHDLVVAFARAAREGGARQLILVSSVGADPASRNTYLRIKGETEEALGALAFDRLDVVRPGLLRGKRGGDRRLGERIGIRVSPITNLFLRGSFGPYAAIDASTVAVAMERLVGQVSPGTYVHHNADLRALARA